MLIPTKTLQIIALVLAVLIAVLRVLIPSVPPVYANVLSVILAVAVVLLPFVTASDVVKAEDKFRLKYSISKPK